MLVQTLVQGVGSRVATARAAGVDRRASRDRVRRYEAGGPGGARAGTGPPRACVRPGRGAVDGPAAGRGVRP
jgi:hypothetical protein